MASLQFSVPGQAPKDFPVEVERVVVGREPSCTLQLNHPSISRQHCAVVRKGEVYTVEDLHSSNGTFVNGRRVSGTFYLNDGDEITIGDCKLRFALAGAAGDPEFAPTLLLRDPKAQEALKSAAPPPAAASLPPTAPMPVRPYVRPATHSAPLPPAPPPPAPPPPAPPAPAVPPPLAAMPAPVSPFEAPTPKPMAPPPIPPVAAVPPVPPVHAAAPVSAPKPPAPPPVPAVPPPLPAHASAPAAAQGNVCPKCRRINTPQARFCGSCGQTLAGAGGSAPAVVAPPQAAHPAPAPKPAATPLPPPLPASAGVVITGPRAYAGFWLRFAAYLLDGLILMIGLLLLEFTVMLVFGLVLTVLVRAVPILAIPLAILSFLVVYGLILCLVWFYFAKQESSPRMATIGKRALGLQVVDLNGQRVTFKRATGRFFGKILSSPLCFGFIMAAFTEKKQALHDILAGCLVIKKP